MLAVTMESRSVILFAVPAALVSLYLHDRRLALRILLRGVLPLAILLVFVDPNLLVRFSSASTNLNVGESVIEELQRPPEERVDFERRLTTFTAIKTFREHPLFGQGYSSIRQIHEIEYGFELSAHGLIPGTLSELGLVGIGILTLTLWRVYRSARWAMRAPESGDPMIIHFAVGLCTLLVLGLFHQTIESVFFGLTLGLLIGICPITRPRRASARIAFQSNVTSPSSK